LEASALHIVEATTVDIPVIRDITYRVWPATYLPIIGQEQLDYMLNLFYTPDALAVQMNSDNKFIVCYEGETAVGFASYSEIEPAIYKLHKLYILTSLQGKGIGRYMVNYISDDIQRSGATELRLNVNIHNLAAKNFYRKSGFTVLRDEDIDIGSGFFMNDHVLSKVIK
jgi:ribosomal protein S18 acetylase RimI-like enzyme